MYWKPPVLGVVAVLVLLVSASSALCDQLDDEVQYLLNHVRTSDIVFIRNGTEHNPEEAYEHMSRKYKYFRKKVKTAEDFVNYSATKSTMSGKKYLVRFPDGSEVYAQDYLLGVLAQYRSSAQ